MSTQLWETRKDFLLALGLGLLASLCGCITTRSKWALDDPDFHARYAAEDNDPLKVVRRAIDATHVSGKGGLIVSGGAGSREGHTLLTGEIGAFGYTTPMTEVRGSLSLAGHWDGDNAGDFRIGGNLGTRLQTPTRIAPFVGLGLFGGYSQEKVFAEDDRIDNDEDGLVDEPGEVEWELDDILLAAYPEVGLHLWLNSHLRLTGSASYYLTTEGRSQDFWFYGVTLSFLGSPTTADVRRLRAEAAEAEAEAARLEAIRAEEAQDELSRQEAAGLSTANPEAWNN